MARPVAGAVASAPSASSPTVAKDPLPAPPAAAGAFQWPVQGKVLSSFGPKANGLHNDGVNIAAEMGAPVRAAQNGVVAYSGNELKGYGNLLLVRHDNGWMTAYAHNSKLLVRRGDTVVRGQTISLAGNSGSVVTPQVHFEIRKGAKAVNPATVIVCDATGHHFQSSLWPSRPARSWMNCQATRPERPPRVAAHSMASAFSVSSSTFSP